MPQASIIPGRQIETESTGESLWLIGQTGSTTGPITSPDRPALRRADEPNVIRQARECIERALTSGTVYSGSMLGWSPGWKVESSPGYILLGSTATEVLQHQLLFWGLRTSAPSSSLHMEVVQLIKRATGLSMDRIAKLIGVSRQALDLWRRDKPIADEHRRRLLAVHEVLERAAVRHGVGGALRQWLDTPRGAEGVTPAQLLERGEVGRARTLAISAPSPRVLRLGLAKRPVAEAFRASAELPPRAVAPDLDDEFLAFARDEDEDVDVVEEE